MARDDSVLGVIGTTCSKAALSGAPIISDSGKVMISPSNTSPELTAPETHHKGYFRTVPNDIVQVKAATRYAYEFLGASRLAVVYNTNQPVMMLQSDYLCQEFSELGGKCVLVRIQDAGNLYMTRIINAFVEEGVDVVYSMFWDHRQAAALLSETRTTPGFEDTPLIFWQGSNMPDDLEQAGESAVGAFVSTTSFDFDQESDAYQVFLEAFRNTFGEEPTTEFNAFAYDATMILLGAIEWVAVQTDKGDTLIDLAAIRDALYNLRDYQGITGLLTCNEFGDCATTVVGKMYVFTSGDPTTFNPGPSDSLTSNPSQVWP